MSWHQASLVGQTARPVAIGKRPGVKGAWNVSMEPETPPRAARQPHDRVEPEQASIAGERPDDAIAVVKPSSESFRLIPGYRTADKKLRAGQDLFGIGWTGGSVFNLLEGWVALYTLLEDGRRQIVHFALPGAVLGVLASKRSQATFGAQALTDVVVSVISDAALGSMSRDEPAIAMRLARSLARDCSMAYDHMTSIGRRSARERIAHLLLELFTRYRAQWPGTRIEEMALPLTQEQIGDATGLTFVHVNRVLSTLRKERIVEFHYRRLRIVDPDRLIEIAGVDPQTVMSWLDRRPS